MYIVTIFLFMLGGDGVDVASSGMNRRREKKRLAIAGLFICFHISKHVSHIILVSNPWYCC